MNKVIQWLWQRMSSLFKLERTIVTNTPYVWDCDAL